MTPESLRAARALLELSCSSLARAAGVSASSISRIERGHLPRPGTAAKLTRFFGSRGVELIAGRARAGATIALVIEDRDGR